jgi:hypothetical protein
MAENIEQSSLVGVREDTSKKLFLQHIPVTLVDGLDAPVSAA